MQLTEQRIGNALLLKVSGRLDRATADAFKTALEPHLEQCKPGGHVIVLDFSSLEYISSAGFRILLLGQRRAKTQAGAFAVAALQSGVKEVFDISNFARVIRCYESVRDALSELSPAALASYP